MLPDNVSRELAALVAVVSLAMIGIVVGVLPTCWKQFEQSFLGLSTPVRKATIRDALFGLIPVLILMIFIFFVVKNPDHVPEAYISAMAVVLFLLVLITIPILIKRAVRKQTVIKSEGYALYYCDAVSYLALSVLFNLFALVGVAPAMLLIKTGPFGPENFESGKWFLIAGIALFLFGIVLFGFTHVLEKSSQWTKQAPKEQHK